MTAPVGAEISGTATNVPSGNSSEFAATVIVSATDSNQDGIPDSWATAHGFSTSATIANLDTDGDGLTNLQEFYAGLDPRSTQSFVRLTNVTRQGSTWSQFPERARSRLSARIPQQPDEW